MTNRIFTAVLAGVLLAPTAAWACGGLFCDTSQPVNQAAERILFAQDDDTLHMHVRITYQGPPTEFGWLLPTPADVEIALSSEQLFLDLDTNFAPRFILQTEFGDNCALPLAAPEADGDPQAGGGGNGGVNVLSREPVGPFDIAVLQAESIMDLRGWLDENGYEIPDQTDTTLQPYLDAGAAFVAVKLLPGQDSGDISPLRLSFSSSRPAIPIVPTSVAADPDMGIIVHVLGASRAIPFNYRHVVINEAAIDWQGGGQNYPDVVSQAADEADGKAFATDFAGPHNGLATRQPYGADTLGRAMAAETTSELLNILGVLDGFGTIDADLQRILTSELQPPEGLDLADLLQCPFCYEPEQIDGIEYDAAAIVARIETEIDEPRTHLTAMFGANPWLTRLYSTLSPAEMDLDPEFEFNADLGEVPNRRVATQRIECDGDGNFEDADPVIDTPSGIRFQLVDGQNPNVIQRQAGETVRGIDVPGAQIIERAFPAGASEVEQDRTEDIIDMNPVRIADASGCNCDVAESDAPGPIALAFALLVLGLRRRRR